MAVQVGDHVWAYAGGPFDAMALAQELADLLGPVGATVVESVLALDLVAVQAQLRDMAARITERRQVEAATAARGATVTELLEIIGAVVPVTPRELLGECATILRSPAARDFLRRAAAECTRDGVPVDPADTTITAAELGTALYLLGREQAGFA